MLSSHYCSDSTRLYFGPAITGQLEVHLLKLQICISSMSPAIQIN